MRCWSVLVPGFCRNGIEPCAQKSAVLTASHIRVLAGGGRGNPAFCKKRVPPHSFFPYYALLLQGLNDLTQIMGQVPIHAETKFEAEQLESVGTDFDLRPERFQLAA